MKATGIVRRVDDLGRVVIPKEIRRNLGIKEGDPLEIYIHEDGGVIYRKYAFNLKSDVEFLCEKLCEHSESYSRETMIRKKCQELMALIDDT